MSAAGLHGKIYDHLGELVGPCLIVGDLVPRVHHSDGIPVLYVTQHQDGPEIHYRTGESHRTLAYPSAWPAPGARSSRYVYARHEWLPWDAPVPIYDQEAASGI